MLHMEYVEDIDALEDPGDGFATQTRQLSAAINQSPVPGMLADAGYRTVAIASSYGEATLVSADDVVDSPTMTMFEEQLLRYTTIGAWIIGTWPEVVAEQHRLASSTPRPRSAPWLAKLRPRRSRSRTCSARTRPSSSTPMGRLVRHWTVTRRAAG